MDETSKFGLRLLKLRTSTGLGHAAKLYLELRGEGSGGVHFVGRLLSNLNA